MIEKYITPALYQIEVTITICCALLYFKVDKFIVGYACGIIANYIYNLMKP